VYIRLAALFKSCLAVAKLELFKQKMLLGVQEYCSCGLSGGFLEYRAIKLCKTRVFVAIFLFQPLYYFYKRTRVTLKDRHNDEL